MPTYEYECEKCGKRFEAFQSITADPLKKCTDETCDGSIKRLFSAGAGFIFKGSGFYITDYRSDTYKKAAQSDGGSSSAGSSSPAKKTESSTSAASNSTSSGTSPASASSSGSSSSGTATAK